MYTKEYKQEMLQKYKSCNISCSYFAKLNGIPRATFLFWVNEEKKSNLKKAIKLSIPNEDQKKQTRKNKTYSMEIKKEIMNKYHSGYAGVRRLATEYDMSYHTIDSWIRYEKEGRDIYNISKKNRSGRRPDFNIDYKAQCEILKKMLKFVKAQREKRLSSLTMLETNIN